MPFSLVEFFLALFLLPVETDFLLAVIMGVPVDFMFLLLCVVELLWSCERLFLCEKNEGIEPFEQIRKWMIIMTGNKSYDNQMKHSS